MGDGLSILIDGSEVFFFEYWKDDDRGFTLAYERMPDKRGVIPCLPTGVDPDDPDLPPVETSFLRHSNRDHLLEIYFRGKIPLKFYSYFDSDKIWKYWCVDTEAIDNQTA